jgi:two-component system phosphate regulon sensor histidine kinase PhoR
MPNPFAQLNARIRSLSISFRIFIIAFPMMTVAVLALSVLTNWLVIGLHDLAVVWALAIPLVFGLVIAYLISLVTAHEITRPIVRLTESVKEIARGNFDHKIHIQTGREISQLSRIFNYMTLELKRIYQININQIIREKIKTEAILRNIADGVIVCGPADDVVMVNDVVERWFGVREKDLIGISLNFFIPDLKFLVAQVKEGALDDVFKDEIEIKPVDGRDELILGAHASKVMDHDEIIAIVIVLRNITREKEIDKMKTELVSVVAHELRSPLTSITGFSEFLRDPELPDASRREYIDIISYESSRLSELINKFLDISRIESGQTVLNKAPIDLLMIISSVLSINSHLAQKRRITIRTEFPESVPPVFADPDLIAQVVLNLFSNALKYSREETEVVVSVDVAGEDEITVSVRDHGFGISPENVKYLFTKFFRAKDDKRVKATEGTGLGLAFVKEIIHQHDGRVQVQSEWGKGSVFSFTLPVFREAAAASPARFHGLSAH